MSARLLLLVLAAADLLGPPIKKEGYSFRPPRQFHLAHMELFQAARPLVIGGAAESPGQVVAALFDGEDENAASLVLAIVDEPFSVGPGARDELSSRVARHFRERLGLEFALERSAVVEGPSRRIEVVGSVRRASQLRQIVAAAWPGEHRHLVITSSIPSGRWETLSGAIAQSYETVRLETASSQAAPLTLAFAVAALVSALLLASIGLWRRRKAAAG